ncbi:MAG: C40 family peptidase [Bacteroidia bacterium]
MKKAYCHLTQIPLRAEARSTAEMVTQLIYGESYTILKKEGEWYLVETDFDSYQGWLSESSLYTGSMDHEKRIQNELMAINPIEGKAVVTTMGSELFPAYLEGAEQEVSDIKDLAFRFLGVPYLWGGRTFAGIDCSGFTQIVFKCLGVPLARDASQQQKQGKAVRTDEIQLGDLVFFEHNFKIAHVGIALGSSKIIHAHGEVRVDQLFSKGIVNSDTEALTHHFHSVRRVR